MIFCLLIGFSYIRSEKMKLPGIPTDLYRMKEFCVKRGIPYLIITDLEDDLPTSEIPLSMVKKGLPASILTLISDEKINKKLRCVNNANELRSKINIPSQCTSLVIYYTGHGIESSILTPSLELLGFSNWINDLVKSPNLLSVTIILDCCSLSGSDLSLPYIFKDNRFRRNKYHHSIKYGNIIITCLSSAQKSSSISNATDTGSLFTNSLISILDKSKYILSYKELLETLCEDLPNDVSLYCNFPLPKYIDSKLVGVKPSFEYDYEHSVFKCT